MYIQLEALHRYVHVHGYIPVVYTYTLQVKPSTFEWQNHSHAVVMKAVLARGERNFCLLVDGKISLCHERKTYFCLSKEVLASGKNDLLAFRKEDMPASGKLYVFASGKEDVHAYPCKERYFCHLKGEEQCTCLLPLVRKEYFPLERKFYLPVERNIYLRQT